MRLPALAFGFSLFRFQGATQAHTSSCLAGVGTGARAGSPPWRARNVTHGNFRCQSAPARSHPLERHEVEAPRQGSSYLPLSIVVSPAGEPEP